MPRTPTCLGACQLAAAWTRHPEREPHRPNHPHSWRSPQRWKAWLASCSERPFLVAAEARRTPRRPPRAEAQRAIASTCRAVAFSVLTGTRKRKSGLAATVQPRLPPFSAPCPSLPDFNWRGGARAACQESAAITLRRRVSAEGAASSGALRRRSGAGGVQERSVPSAVSAHETIRSSARPEYIIPSQHVTRHWR